MSNPLHTTQLFRLPTFPRILFRVLSVVMLGLSAFTIAFINTSPVMVFVLPVFLFLAWSMFAYTRQYLLLTDSLLTRKGSLKSQEIDWNDITQVDLKTVGKYDDPQIILYYGDRTLTIARSFFLTKQFKAILLLLEQKLPATLFTTQYHHTRQALPASWQLP
ncbi:hypothetical protein [Chitinophaga nivalis]|uniref:YcxB-like protein domain-containing protein n=1 Tax=Chitinophaga nivalis TaxID=2991709 RepID=A0ABT3IHT2_9BACT|nr:hypothetical protein [Chitinophaga nivalis]MCW3466954.1 hypothetical protein [Chitinophaga nivalis]MCW3483355.1 hypothetical protein [Chitinophaga nivalis]